MPWTETSKMDSRLCFVAACLRGEAPVSVLCERHGISRKTGYKWLGRYGSEGAAGLEERSRARHAQPQAIDAGTAALLLALRAERPSWGPRKLLARLAADHPGRDWPAASTVGDLLRREGLSQGRRLRGRAASVPAPTLVAPSAPNEVWSADFKGWFRTGDGVRCEPFTVTDGYSRYILACEPVPQVSAGAVMPILARLFQAHGLPRALRTDNGSPFANRNGLAGLTRMSVWLLKLGVWPDRIAPGRPDQNGRHERMHRVLGEDAARPPAATLPEQQARMEAWRHDYNSIRPHEALGQACPASLWRPSPRPWPASLPTWEYPADHHPRRVTSKGYVAWRDGDWAVRFRCFDLAVLSDATDAIRLAGLARPAEQDAGAGQATAAPARP